MNVIECDDSHRSAWDAYVRSSSTASFYHLYGWRAVNAEALGHSSLYLAAVEGGIFVGVFPIVYVRSRLFGKLACSMPFVNFGGPCGDTELIEHALLEEAARFVERERVAYLEIRSRRRFGMDLPTSEHKVSMTVDLDPDPKVLWTAFKHGQRQDIRKAMKNGLSGRCGGAELLAPFYAVITESWRDLGTPLYDKFYFERILAEFPGCIRICVVSAGQEHAAAAFYALHGKTAEGMWLGGRSKFRKQMAGYLLYWHFLVDACENGFERFHLGRSTGDSGGEVHKRKWNAYPTQLYWQYILGTSRTMPALNVDNPRYRLAIQTWRRLPLPVTQWLGPAIARSIP